MKKYLKPPLCLRGAINLQTSLTASSQRDGLKWFPYDYTDYCSVPFCCASFSNKSDNKISNVCKYVLLCVCVSNILEQSGRKGSNFPETSPRGFSRRAHRREIHLFFTPRWCFSPTCRPRKDERSSFISFKRQRGFILS